MDKLKNFLAGRAVQSLVGNVEKIILGLVLLGLVVMAVIQLLRLRSDLDEIKNAKISAEKQSEGKSVSVTTNTNHAVLIRKVTGAPPILNLTNGHLVFNPVLWKKESNAIFRMTEDRPLGVAALKVESISSIDMEISPEAFGSNPVRYRIAIKDSLPELKLPGPLRDFLKPTPKPLSMARNLVAQRTPVLYQGGVGTMPEWYIGLIFIGAVQGLENKYQFEIELQLATETNTLKIISGEKRILNRGYEATMLYERTNSRFANYRVGRKFLIDGEVFSVAEVTATKLTIISDILSGGNGKLYELQLKNNKPVQPVVAVKPEAALPAPVLPAAQAPKAP